MGTLLLLTLLLATQAAHAFYDSSKGKWINRDPIEEDGGANLSGFVGNNPVDQADELGLVIVGFYGFDKSNKWPDAGNLKLEAISAELAATQTVLGPATIHGMPPTRDHRLYASRDDAVAFVDLLRYLDTNKDGTYNPPCDTKEPIKIFGWSWGGASAVELANRIKRSPKFKDKEVQVLVTIDPVTLLRPANHTVPDNVQYFVNFFQTKGKGSLFHGSFLSSRAQRSWQYDANLDGEQLAYVEEEGRTRSVNHTFIIWKLKPDIVEALR